MKKRNVLWIIALLSVMLAVAGCGDDADSDSSDEVADSVDDGAVDDAPEPADEVVDEPEEPEEPELPDEGVQDAGPDVTAEEVDPEPVDDTGEGDGESDSDAEDSGDSSDGLTAENYRVVSLKDLKAYPEEMTVKVGTTVEWRNVNDNLKHIIGWKGQPGMGVKPEPILQGESWSYTFMEPGEIKWFSTARPTVQGVITIEE